MSLCLEFLLHDFLPFAANNINLKCLVKEHCNSKHNPVPPKPFCIIWSASDSLSNQQAQPLLNSLYSDSVWRNCSLLPLFLNAITPTLGLFLSSWVAS